MKNALCIFSMVAASTVAQGRQANQSPSTASPESAIMLFKKQETTRKIGVAVVHSSTNKVLFIGAGTEVGNGGDNFDWMDIWSVTAKATAAKIVGKATARLLRGDALHVEKSESASALIYWNGRRYVWRQMGD
jgi:hypothetical protein